MPEIRSSGRNRPAQRNSEPDSRFMGRGGATGPPGFPTPRRVPAGAGAVLSPAMERHRMPLLAEEGPVRDGNASAKPSNPGTACTVRESRMHPARH
jgi:hypothetical protein